MVDQQKSLAGRKGGAVRRARNKARETGIPVYDIQFNFMVNPEGRIDEIPEGLMPNGAQGTDFVLNDRAEGDVGKVVAKIEQGPRDITAADGDDDDGPETVDETGDYLPGAGIDPAKIDGPEGDEARAAPELGGEVIETDFTPQPGSVIEELNKLLGQGLSEDDALTLINAKRGTVATGAGMAPPRGPNQPATPGEGERFGPDPIIVAKYEEMMKTYVPPRTDLTITVENPDGEDFQARIPIRYLDYLTKAAMLETAKRRRPVNLADFVQMIVRRFKATDTDAAILLGTIGGSGPADTFNPNTGLHG